MTGTYTDDMLGVSSSKKEMEQAKKEIEEKYQIEETDMVQFVLGMCLVHDGETGTATLSMPAYWNRFFVRYNLHKLKPKVTPYSPGLKLSKDMSLQNNKEHHYMKDKPFRKLLGGLQFGQGACRLDIVFEVNNLSRFVHDPGPAHWQALLHVCWYLVGTKYRGITYQRRDGGLNPKTYCDANHMACTDTCCSVTGVVTILAGGPVFCQRDKMW